MPRANRYILPGHHYHVTHRCHNRSFLLRFAKDRDEYRRQLREALAAFDVYLLTYCITLNHTHLLVGAQSTEALSALMQKLEGEFAQYYNIRKKRSGAFWGGRYHATMIDSGEHLWHCMTYVDLNMVRAGAVSHPQDWSWCGYSELVGRRQRYRLIDRDKLLDALGGCSGQSLSRSYEQAIRETICREGLVRNPIWTESIAVGGAAFVDGIEQATRNRVELTKEERSGRWTLREAAEPYG